MSLQEFLDELKVTPSELGELRKRVALPNTLAWDNVQWCRRKKGAVKFLPGEQYVIKDLVEKIRRELEEKSII